MQAVIIEQRTVRAFCKGPFRFLVIDDQRQTGVPRFHLTMRLGNIVLQEAWAETIEGLGVVVPGEEP